MPSERTASSSSVVRFPAARAGASGKLAPTKGRRDERTKEADAEAAKLRESRSDVPADSLEDLAQQLTEQMNQAAMDLKFELAARIRDELHAGGDRTKGRRR